MADIDVKAIRAALKLTQAALAIELGVDVMTVRRWEWKKARPSQLARRQLERLLRGKKMTNISQLVTAPELTSRGGSEGSKNN